MPVYFIRCYATGDRSDVFAAFAFTRRQHRSAARATQLLTLRAAAWQVELTAHSVATFLQL